MSDLMQKNKQMQVPATSLLRSKTAGVIGLIAMLIFALHASTRMVGAGDTWVALACGRHFYNHGVDTNEPFSANSHRQGPTAEEIATWPDWAQTIAGKVSINTLKYWHPTGWIDQNWLTHVIFHWLAYKSPIADGPQLVFNSLVYWKFAIYILTVICVYYTARVMGVHPALSAAAACAALFIGRSFLDIRPAGFSNLLVAVFLLVLALSTYRNYLYIWLLLPATVFWANVHGGYIYVFIMLTPVVGIHVLALLWRKLAVKLELAPANPAIAPLPGTTLPAVWHTIAVGFLAFLASIIFNPFHLTNITHTFQISISENAEGWRNVHEWWPAFRWDNPVGTAFPFLVMTVTGIGLVVIWSIIRLMVPKQVKVMKLQAGYQPKQSNTLAYMVGFAGAALVIWAIMISCSMTDIAKNTPQEPSIAGSMIASFLINGLFVGILWLAVFVNVHIIYLILPFGLFLLYATNNEPGYAGRYIFPFVTTPFYCGLFAIASRISKKPAYSPLNMVYVLAASIATILISAATVNPFKFTEPIWHLGQFLNLRRIWSPLFEANLEINYPYYFQVIYAVNFLCIAAWFVVPYVKELMTDITGGKAEAVEEETPYRRPKIDLALIVVAALTAYMAYRSRRFIPIAGIAACPLIALLADQIIQTAAAARNFRKYGRVSFPRMPFWVQILLTTAAVILVGVLGVHWGIKFKKIYMDPWATDAKFDSMFMRMTASAAKPFDACEFITANKMRGNMLNYWTEGGFIAWGQTPDADGHTPLQLFMDGRAQAAYDYQAYGTWSELMSGGPTPRKAMMRNQNMTPDDYVQTGTWIDSRLKQYKVWVVLMPTNQFESSFVKGLEYAQSWRLIFLSDKEKLFVDISTPRGKQLFDGIEDGNTIYPNEVYRDLMIAHNSLLFENTPEQLTRGLGFAIKAYDADPTRTPLQLIQIYNERHPQLRQSIDGFWQKVVDDFEANRKEYFKHSGYYFRAVGVLIGISRLEPQAAAQNKKDVVELYEREKVELQKVIEEMQDRRW
ncbi:MAG: hypothetical protein ABSF37_11060 [Sedimentisphaerales bacterium]